MKIEFHRITVDQYPYIAIYSNDITPQIKQVIDFFSDVQQHVIANQDEKSIVLDTNDIYMLESEGKTTNIFTQRDKYTSKKRLIEIESGLGSSYMRVSKYNIINLSYIQAIEPSFNGCMVIFLKNGLKTYISRKYLPSLKGYLGI